MSFISDILINISAFRITIGNKINALKTLIDGKQNNLSDGLHTTVASNQVNVVLNDNTYINDKSGFPRIHVSSTLPTGDMLFRLSQTGGQFSFRNTTNNQIAYLSQATGWTLAGTGGYSVGTNSASALERDVTAVGASAGWARNMFSVSHSGTQLDVMGYLGGGSVISYGYLGGTSYATKNAIRWSPNGFVGIGLVGTTSPTHALEVLADAEVGAYVRRRTTVNTLGSFIGFGNTSTDYGNLGFNNDNFYVRDASGGIKFRVSNASGVMYSPALTGTGNRLLQADLSGGVFATNIDPSTLATTSTLGNYYTKTETNANFHKLAKSAIEATSGGYYGNMGSTVDANDVLGNVSTYTTMFGGVSRSNSHVISFGVTSAYGFQFVKAAATNSPLSVRFRNNNDWTEEDIAYQSYVDAKIASATNFVLKTGDAMSGALDFTSNGVGVKQAGNNILYGTGGVNTVLMGNSSGSWATGGIYFPPSGLDATKQWILRGQGNLEMPTSGSGYIARTANGSRTFNKVYQNYTAGASTGTLSIKFPQVSSGATMFDVTIKFYSYSLAALAELRVSFYRQGNNLINQTAGLRALLTKTSTFPTEIVKVGIDANGMVCINIGETTTSWSSYLSFEVERVEAKFTGYNNDWGSGWSHVFETSTTGYSTLVNTPIEVLGAGNYFPTNYLNSNNSNTWAGNLLAVPTGTYSATVSASSTNLPFGTATGGLISIGQGAISTRILGARDNSDNLWFQSGDGTGAWRQLASREWANNTFALAGKYLSIEGNGVPVMNASGDAFLVRNASVWATGLNRPNNTNSAVVNFTAYESGGQTYGFSLGARGNRLYFVTETASVYSDWNEVTHDGNLDAKVSALGYITATALGGYVLQTSLNTQLANYVTVNSSQNITATKTFTVSPIVPNGTLAGHTVNLGQMQSYVTGLGYQTASQVNTIVNNAVAAIPSPGNGTVVLQGINSLSGTATFSLNQSGNVIGSFDLTTQTKSDIQQGVDANSVIPSIVDGVNLHYVTSISLINIPIEKKKTIINIDSGLLGVNITVDEAPYEGYELAVNGCGEWNGTLSGNIQNSCKVRDTITIASSLSTSYLFWWHNDLGWVQAI